ncbi:hypothetical protein OC845_002315 [Tilletia horrida]|nr:hypothetical protein OC845_002315 [Tilletia horrida]
MDQPQLPPARISDKSKPGPAGAGAGAGPAAGKKPTNPDRKPRNFPTLQRIYLLTFVTKLIRSLFDPNLGPAPARLLHIQHSVLAQLSDADPTIKSYLQPDGLRRFKDRSGKAASVSAIPNRNHNAQDAAADDSLPDDEVDPVAIECLRDIFERGATVQSVEQGVQARAAFYANNNLAADLSSVKGDTSLVSPSKKRKQSSNTGAAGQEGTSSRRRRTRSGGQAHDTSLFESNHALLPPPPPPSSAAGPSGSSAASLPSFLTSDHLTSSTSGFGEAILNDAPDPSMRTDREEAALAAAAAAAAAAVAAASHSQAHLDGLADHDGSVSGGAGEAGPSHHVRTATSGANNEAVAADALRLMKTSAVVNNPRTSSQQHSRRTQGLDSPDVGVDDDLGPSSSPPGPSGAMAAAISAAQELARQQQELEQQRHQHSPSSSSAAAVTGPNTAESDFFARELANIMSAAPSPLPASTVELARSLVSASGPVGATAAEAPVDSPAGASSSTAVGRASSSTSAEQKAAATKAKSMLLRRAMQVQARSRSQLHQDEDEEEEEDDDDDSEEEAVAEHEQLGTTHETGEELADTYVQGIHRQILAESAQGNENERVQGPGRQRATTRSTRDPLADVDQADDDAVEDLFSGED